MNEHRRAAVKRAFVRIAVVTMAATGVQVSGAAPAFADPSKAAWAKLRMCESSDRYAVNTGSGYYGAYQFDLPTWQSVGGRGRPDQATPREQDYRALYLYRMRGWQPWECAGMLGLSNDGDARSKIVPSYADSAYIGGTGEPAPEPDPEPDTGPSTMPVWPGVVYAHGDCDDKLRQFQLRMNRFDLGYKFKGTGCYLGKTKEAVVALQRANGIRDSGRLGPKTWKAAWHGKAPK